MSVKSARRTIEILGHLADRGTPGRMIDLARQLNVPPSSMAALLSTLVEAGVLVHQEHDNTYRLSSMVLEWAGAVSTSIDLETAARPVLTTLATEAGGTANLAVLDERDVVYVAKVDDPVSHIQLRTRVGGRLPAHATALGKVLLAGLPDNERYSWLERAELAALTPMTITSRVRLIDVLNSCRRAGFAIDDEESHAGIRCTAGPVMDHTGAVVAAVSVSVVKVEALRASASPEADTVVAAAGDLSRELGFRPRDHVPTDKRPQGPV